MNLRDISLPNFEPGLKASDLHSGFAEGTLIGIGSDVISGLGVMAMDGVCTFSTRKHCTYIYSVSSGTYNALFFESNNT